MYWFRELVYQFFDQQLLHIYVKAERTDEGKELKIIPVLLRYVRETVNGRIIRTCDILL